MNPPLIFVHLNLFGYDLYLDKCVEISCSTNPEHQVYLVTKNQTIREHIEQLDIANLQVVYLSELEVEEVIKPIDEVMFHDGINTREFELICFGRHALCLHLINNGAIQSDDGSYYYCDSDATVFAPLDQVFSKAISAGSICANADNKTYFAHWSKEAVETFCNPVLLREFFDAAREQGIRTNDMNYLIWCIKNKHIERIDPDPVNKGGVGHLDTIRRFLACHGIFAAIEGGLYLTPEHREQVVTLPKGYWSDVEFIVQFGNSELLEQLYSIKPNAEDQGCSLYVHMDAVRDCISKVRSSWNGFDLWQKDRWQVDEIANHHVMVGMIHFQGPAKYLVKPYYEFWQAQLISQQESCPA